jgi:hypothetical protein
VDLPSRLKVAYQDEARHCVMFISKAYVEKDWTNFERKAAIMRAIRERSGYILPLRLDDSEVPGLPDGLGYVDLREITLHDAFDLLCKKIGSPIATQSPSALHRLRAHPADFLFLVVTKASGTPRVNLRCHLLNTGDAAQEIRAMSLRIHDPDGSSIAYRWGLLYDQSGSVQTKISGPSPIEMPPGESGRLLGIQFVAPSSIHEYRWSTGRYRLDLVGWAAADQRQEVLQETLEASLTDFEEERLREWAMAAPEKWTALLDPDEAVAIPATITSASA